MMTRIAFILLALLTFISSAGSADAQTTLRYKFVKGQTNAYELNQDSKIAQSIMGKEVNTDIKQTIDLSVTVDELTDNGGAKVTWKFTRVKLGISGVQDVVVDSADANEPADNPLAKSMAGVVKLLAKVTFTATQSATGELTDLKIPEDVVKGLRDLPGSEQVGEMFTEPGLKNLMTQNGLVLPKDAVVAGTSWTQKASTKLPIGKMVNEMKYTYQGTDVVAGKTLQKITYAPSITIEAAVDSPITIKIAAQKGGGVIHFDNDAGRLQNLALDQVMEMTVSVANQELTQTISQKMTMRLTK